jgi:hypothetical protein
MQMIGEQLRELIAKCLGDFYARRMAKIRKLKLKDILQRKNPYLYKALGTESAIEIVKTIVTAYVSSSDETIFGDAFFEPIVLAVSGGSSSPSGGVDVVIETRSKYKAIAVKSGPNIFNNAQKKKQHEQFMELRSRLLKLKKQFDPILAYCYGRLGEKRATDKIYREVAGQEFWEEITGDPDFYKKLIDLIDKEVVGKRKQEYKDEWERTVTKHVIEFGNSFCDKGGAINWEKLVEFNSGKKQPAE